MHNFGLLVKVSSNFEVTANAEKGDMFLSFFFTKVALGSKVGTSH